MPYKDKDKQKQAQRDIMSRKRHVNPGEKVCEPDQCEPKNPVNPDVVNPDVVNPVNPVNPEDWTDRRNYSEAYLKCLGQQKGKLTEASRVAMKGSRHPVSFCYAGRKETDTKTCHLREWLKDSVQRKKLGVICLALKRHGKSDDVTFGVHGPSFTEVGDILDETVALN